MARRKDDTGKPYYPENEVINPNNEEIKRKLGEISKSQKPNTDDYKR